MEQSGVQEILSALKLHSSRMDQKLNDLNEHFEKRMDEIKDQLDHRMNQLDHRMDQLENRMDQLDNRMNKLEFTMENRFNRMEKKLDGVRVDLFETQETVDYLATKSVQHEKKLRNASI